ncbi:MAG: hypothetical protein UX77_C0019G0008 [Parcubacteria group bacterium GW2011_GWA1_47_11]|nr:MAG: hypothetical protein UX77_C0019G0008 [Parcubacteria group bacterium GW2011_GWA1_47_11]
MSPKRILIFSLAYHPMVGGAEIAVKEITDRITDIEFDMITMRFNAVHPEKEQIGNCMVYRINTSKNFFPFRAFLFAKKLHSDRPYDATWAIMANWAGFAAVQEDFHACGYYSSHINVLGRLGKEYGIPRAG